LADNTHTLGADDWEMEIDYATMNQNKGHGCRDALLWFDQVLKL
jgi:hypothetical protein